MSYFAPYIDGTGLHVPSYEDIRNDLVEQAKQIYGQDIYLGNDSQDYQMISAFSLKTYDTMQLLQLIYNNRGPQTAIGSALDGVIKLNGIRRKESSYSTCVVRLQGDAGTVVSNGVVEDSSSQKWSLPKKIAIGSDGTIEVSAICQELGAIEAPPGSITKIVTPTKGWIGVNNLVPAVTGQPIETDSEVRGRQAISVANPSQTLLDGTVGGVASVLGVKRYKVYENDTNVTDANGIPGHSIAAVVEGGMEADIAEQIYIHKGIGGGTHGDVVTEHLGNDGLVTVIRFFRPIYVGIDISLSIRRNTGYVPDMKIQIERQIRTYLENLDIGNDVTITGVLASTLSLIGDLSRPPFTIALIAIARAGDESGVADIKITFNEVAAVGKITVTEVR